MAASESKNKEKNTSIEHDLTTTDSLENGKWIQSGVERESVDLKLSPYFAVLDKEGTLRLFKNESMKTLNAIFNLKVLTLSSFTESFSAETYLMSFLTRSGTVYFGFKTATERQEMKRSIGRHLGDDDEDGMDGVSSFGVFERECILELLSHSDFDALSTNQLRRSNMVPLKAAEQ